MENVSSRCGKSDNAPRLRFPEFSGEWEEKKIKEFANCYAGATPSTKERKYWENGTIPWLSSGEVNKKHISFTDNFITKIGYDSCSTKMIPANTVVMALAGQGKTRGTVAITEIELCTNQSLASIVTNETVDDKFLLYYLETQYSNLRAISSGDGTRGGLNLNIINEYSVFLASLPEQKKIAAFFTLLDRRIQKQRQLVEFLKTYKRGVFSVLLNSFSKYETLLLENCASIKKGEQLNKTDMIENGKYYVLNGGIAASGRTDNFNTDKNTISISEGGNSCGFVLFNTEKFWSGGHCYTLQNLKQNINNQYLFHYLKFHEKQIMSLRVGSGLPNIQKSELEKFEVLLPSEDIQNKIANIMSNITSYEDVVKKELLNLDKLKLALLQKMFI